MPLSQPNQLGSLWTLIAPGVLTHQVSYSKWVTKWSTQVSSLRVFKRSPWQLLSTLYLFNIWYTRTEQNRTDRQTEHYWSLSWPPRMAAKNIVFDGHLIHPHPYSHCESMLPCLCFERSLSKNMLEDQLSPYLRGAIIKKRTNLRLFPKFWYPPPRWVKKNIEAYFAF